MIAALGLVTDINRLKSSKKNLEVRIENLNESRNYLVEELHGIRETKQSLL
jgi:hypothetical protein